MGKQKMSPNKAKKMCLSGKILIPIGVALFITFIIAFILLAFMGKSQKDGSNPMELFFYIMIFGPSEIGLAALIAGIVLLVKGKKALPHKIK
ncbi:hypothetical protein FACS1894218_5600 [Bacilli bacterium]|nr:hypothetical protein FACS1894218_5600 [Bacilli bacterium]